MTMKALDPAPNDSALHRWVWRWHGYAGFSIVPFIFWMSLTGLPYVWEMNWKTTGTPSTGR